MKCKSEKCNNRVWKKGMKLCFACMEAHVLFTQSSNLKEKRNDYIGLDFYRKKEEARKRKLAAEEQDWTGQ